MTTNENTYTLQTVNFTESDGTEDLLNKFSFNAENDQDAENKAQDWALYHGLCYREDVRVRKATDHEAENWLHNEYLK